MSASAKLIAAVYIENLAAVVDILASSVGVSLVVYRTTKELVASCSLVSDARRSHSLTADPLSSPIAGGMKNLPVSLTDEEKVARSHV